MHSKSCHSFIKDKKEGDFVQKKIYAFFLISRFNLFFILYVTRDKRRFKAPNGIKEIYIREKI
jgi:hypothetical protein